MMMSLVTTSGHYSSFSLTLTSVQLFAQMTQVFFPDGKVQQTPGGVSRWEDSGPDAREATDRQATVQYGTHPETQKQKKIQTYIYNSIHWEDDDLKTSEESDISAYANDTIDGNINTNIGN